MNKRRFLFFIALSMSVSFFAQQADPVVLKINGKSIHKSELLEAYNEGFKQNLNGDTTSIDRFLQMYIDFRLNLEEARSQGLDTTSTYKREYGSYKLQMSSMYLNDTTDQVALVRKIYNRMQQNVEVNHVLLPFDKSVVFPADTLALYNKALELRKELLKKGFVGKAFVDNTKGTSIKMDAESKNGYIGWVEPFMFSALVEDAIYSLPVKEISMPIRTMKGYHLVQVLARRPAKGWVNVEQVLFNFPNIPATQQQIDSVGKFVRKEYEKIKKTSDFQSLCDEFAEVNGTKDCRFGSVGLSSMLPASFISAAMNLSIPGELSKPVMTDYGFHILRLIESFPVPELSVIEKDLYKKIHNSDRAHVLKIQHYQRLAEQFNLSVNKKAYARLLLLANTLSPSDSIFTQQVRNKQDILFTIDGKKSYSVGDFAKYIESKVSLAKLDPNNISIMQVVEKPKSNLSTDNLDDLLETYQYRKLLDYAQETLEDRIPDFRRHMNEFSDGILLFAVKKNNVWDKAETDKQGLNDYFTLNKAKYTLEGTKYKGLIVYAKNKDKLKEAETISKKIKNRESLMDALVGKFNADSVVLRLESGIWEQGSNEFVDNKIFGGPEPEPLKGYPYFFVAGYFIDKPEDFRDVRNAVELDYQEQLEKEWGEYLRKKYSVEIDESVLKSIE